MDELDEITTQPNCQSPTDLSNFTKTRNLSIKERGDKLKTEGNYQQVSTPITSSRKSFKYDRENDPEERKKVIRERIKLATISKEELAHIGGSLVGKSLKDMDEFDGEVIGAKIMMLRGEKRSTRKWYNGLGSKKEDLECVDSIIEENKGLKELEEKHHWFNVLVEGMLNNNLSVARTPNTTIGHISKKEAKTLGGKLSNGLRNRGTAEAGVEGWIGKSKVLIDFDKKYAFFTPMCKVIGQHKLRDALWGMRFRFYSGASLSLLNVFTDFNQIKNFFIQGSDLFGWMNLAFIFASALILIFLVIAQNHKRGVKVIAYEMLLCIFMMKGPIGARRVANGNVQVEGTLFNPQFELTRYVGD